jgi:hypothetical protein
MCTDGIKRELIEIPFEKVRYLYLSKDYSLGKNFLVFRGSKNDKDSISLVNNQKFNQDITTVFLNELCDVATITNKEKERKLNLLSKRVKNKKEQIEMEQEFEVKTILKHLPKVARLLAEQGEFCMEVHSFEVKKNVLINQLKGLEKLIYDKLKTEGYKPHLTKMSPTTKRQGIYIAWSPK